MTTEATTWILFIINGFQLYYMLCAFLKSKIKNLWVGASIYTCVCLLLRLVSNQVDDVELYNSLLIVVAVLQAMLIYPLFEVKKWYMPWLLEAFIMVGMLLLQIPTTTLAELVTGYNMLKQGEFAEYSLNYAITTSLNCMMFMIIIFVIYVFIFSRKYSASKMLLNATIGIILYQTLVISVFYMLCWKNGENAIFGGVLFVAFSILSDVMVLKSLEHMLEKMHIEREWKKLSVQRQQEYEHYKKVQETIEQIRMERHDYVNYMQAIERLLVDEKDYGEAGKVILEIHKMHDRWQEGKQ